MGKDIKGLEDDEALDTHGEIRSEEVLDNHEMKDGEEESEQEIEEGQKAKQIRQPQQPTRQELEEHELTHVPFRDWCVHCCKGKVRNNPHRVNKEKDEETKENATTTISMDYMYLTGKNKEDDKYPILVMVDRKTKAIVGHAVQCKGSKDDWAIKRVLLDIEDFGYAGIKIILKSDQEPAMVDLQRKVMEARRAETVPKNSQVGESQANGEAENAIKRLQEQVRTIKDDLESKTGLDIDMAHNIMPWLIEWAGVTLNRYLVYKDGHTAYNNITGKSSKRPVANFGEKVLYLPLKTERMKMDKSEAKMREGVWLGIRNRSDEAIIGTSGGTVKARTIRRLPKDKRWDPDMINTLRGSPRRPVPGVESDHVPTDTQIGFAPGIGEDDVVIAQTKKEEIRVNVPRAEEAPRRMYITKAFIEKFGKTPGCPGCDAIERGKYGVHNQKCHDRIKKELAKDEEGRRKLHEERHRIERRTEVALDKAILQEIEKDPDLKRENDAHNEEITQIRKKHKREEQEPASSSTSPIPSTSQASPPVGATNMDMDDGRDAKRGAENAADDEARKKHRGNIEGMGLGIDVSEICSPPCFVSIAQRLGLRPGCSLDITTQDVDGRNWDLDQKEMRNHAIRKIADEKPFVLITSPMCADLSLMTNANWDKIGLDEKEKRLNRARMHLEFVCVLHLIQHRAGRYFVHIHPRSANSWREACIQGVFRKTGAVFTNLDRCMSGERVPANKTTTLMSNMPAVQVFMNKACDRTHQHVLLAGGARHNDAQKYSETFCEELAKAIKLQKVWDSKGVKLIAAVKEHKTEGEHIENTCEIHKVPDEEAEYDMHGDDTDIAWDDISGKHLDPAGVRKARAAEIDFYRKMGVYVKVPTSECFAKTGQKPIGVRWVDIDKGDRDRPNYRSRLVAKQYRQERNDDLYAATPPIESLRAVISSATTGGQEKVIMVNDVSRAYMYAPCDEDIYVELCEEDRAPGEDHLCGKLVKAMYGTRTAARMWQREVAGSLRAAGFSAGRTSPCLFYHKDRDIMVFLHGDDFVSSGSPENLKWFKSVLSSKYCIKTTVIGEDSKFEKQVRVLNRLVRWWPGEGVTIEADPRHVEILIESVEVQNEKTLKITGEKDAGNVEDSGEGLEASKASKFRSDVARLNYLAADRPDVMFAVKELARRMACPAVNDAERVRRLVRYLKGKPRAVAWYRYQEDPSRVEGYTDSDWAGCRTTRRSTSGGCILYGSHYLKGWSRTQSTRALSSAEAELYGIVKTSAEVMGIVSMFKDFGKTMAGHILCDASAALGVVRRKGVGKIRHLDTDLLWIQEKNENKELVYNKVAGTQNPADLFTKYLSADVMDAHLGRLGYAHTTGKDEIGLSIHPLGLCGRQVRQDHRHLLGQ